MKKKTVTVEIPQSPEARPVAMLVQIASKFESRIYMENQTRKVNAKSIMGMMALGLDNGEEVIIYADGSDEDEAISSIERYLSNKIA